MYVGRKLYYWALGIVLVSLVHYGKSPYIAWCGLRGAALSIIIIIHKRI